MDDVIIIKQLINAADDMLYQRTDTEQYSVRADDYLLRAVHSLACSTLAIAKLLDKVTRTGDAVDVKNVSGGY